MAKTIGTVFSFIMMLVSISIAVVGLIGNIPMMAVVGAVLAALFLAMTVWGRQG